MGGILVRAAGIVFLVTLTTAHAFATEAKEARGRKLVSDLGCPVCHDIRGQETTAPKEAPDLSLEGEKVQPAWLFDFLRKPHTLRPWLKATMPNFRLTEWEALAITKFITTLRDPKVKAGESAGKRAVSAARLAEGKKIFDLLECTECHPAEGKKTDTAADELAPDFALTARRLRPEWVLRWLKDPQTIQPGTKMPTYFDFDDEVEDKDSVLAEPEKKIELLRDYLFGQGLQNPSRDFAEAKEKYPKVGAADGATLVRSLNCAGCHKISAIGAGEKVGPILDREGSRVQQSWLKNFLKSPSPIRLTLTQRMPEFRIPGEAVDALAAYLTTLVDEKGSDIFPGGNVPEGLVAEGKRLLNEELGCLTCHRIGEKGALGGPVLTHAAKRLKAGWIYRWIKNPKHFQPKTPMPRVELTDNEARAITAYLSSLR